MTTSILNDALLLRNEPGEKLQEYLISINLNIFDPIFHNSASIQEAKQKVLYILTCYSEESPLLILRQDARVEKEGVCQYLDIPDFLRKRLIELTEPETRQATTQYLTQFAGPLFKALMFLKIQYDDLELDITNRVFKITTTKKNDAGEEVTTDTPDVKEQGKAVTELARLGKAINSMELQIRAQDNYPGLMEMKDWKHRGEGKKISLGGRGISIENSNLIKKRSNG